MVLLSIENRLMILGILKAGMKVQKLPNFSNLILVKNNSSLKETIQ